MTAGPYTDTTVPVGPTNDDILKATARADSIQIQYNNLKEKYPLEQWSYIPPKGLRMKIGRLQEKIKRLRKNKKLNAVEEVLSEKFEFPKTNKMSTEETVIQDLVPDHEIICENRELKRQLENEQQTSENHKIQVQHYEIKTNLLLESLNIITTKHKAAIQNVKNVTSLKLECEQWEKKYDDLSQQLDKTLDNLQASQLKLQTQCARNMNKKLKRRDEKIDELKTKLCETECILTEKDTKIREQDVTCQELGTDIERLKKYKRNLLVKICRLNKKTGSNAKDINENEIQKLKCEIKEKEKTITELEQINELLDMAEIECFYEGKYTNDLRETIMSLVTQCGVSLNKVNEVIKTVVTNITGKTLSRLPSAGVRSRLFTEAKRVAQVQVVHAMLRDQADVCTSETVTDNNAIFSGNCLHQDGTSKFHRHFQSFQVTTSDKTTYSLGLSEVGSADAATLMEAFQQQMSDLSEAVRCNHDQAVSKLITSIVSTMSDQGATNPVFNRQLAELKQSLLPEVIENWDGLSLANQTEVGKISNFFCKMHIFINMASETDNCLVTYENNVCTGKNPYSFEWKESGGSRLTRTVSKAFTMHGCEKSGVGSHFSTYLKDKKVSNQLITFRGHRFNHLFYAAGATYHHLNDIRDFLDNWTDPNDLLKSISFDCREKAYTSSLRALGIIDKLITGPLWRIIEGTDSIINLNPQLEFLQSRLQQLSQDASSLLAGELIFPGVDIHKDAIYETLFSATDNPVEEMYTQMALKLSLAGMLLILERQAKDQLPGGAFFKPSPSDHTHGLSVPTTNTCSERDFAQLDILMRLKPSASTVAYEAVIMWSNNKTSQWLTSLSPSEKEIILDEARKSAPQVRIKFQERQRALFERKLQILQSKKEKKVEKENKQYSQKLKLTGKLNDLGGLWVSEQDMSQYIQQVSSDPDKDNKLKDALICQLQFRKKVLGCKGSKEKFQQSSQGKHYTLQQLQHNLLDIISINGEDADCTSSNTVLQYLPDTEVHEKMTEAKAQLSSKLLKGRRKIQVSQQSQMLPDMIKDPNLLVGKQILQKFKDSESNEITWYRGEVHGISKLNGRSTKFEVKYEDGDEGNFPLLIDMEKGELIIQT